MATNRYSNSINMEDLMNSLFGTLGKMPPVDVVENDDSYQIIAEVPGYDPKDIDIAVERHMITISGKMPEKKEEEGRRYFIRERESYDMNRSFQLPQDADEEKISADFSNGVLTIKVMKEPKSLPRKINVQIGSSQPAIETTADEAKEN